jgi:hypothetical protein
MKSLLGRQCCSSLVAVMFALSVSSAFAAPAEEEPEDLSANQKPKAAALSVPDPNDPNAPQNPQSAPLRVEPGYRSDKLGGEFVGKTMKITVGGNANGQSYIFFGVRALQLDRDSPLRRLGMVEGDVITRLDGNTLDIGMSMAGNRQYLPELDQHYGMTDIRWIKQGTSRVIVEKVQLDRGKQNNNNGGNTLEAP